MTTKYTAEQVAKHLVSEALDLLEWADGDTEHARTIWELAFYEAERMDHENFRASYIEDESEVAGREQGVRFDTAIEKRSGFRIIKD